MDLNKCSVHFLFGALCLASVAAQEADEFVKSSKSVDATVAQVLNGVYAQYADPVLHTVDVRYVEVNTAFPYPIEYRYAMNGEDRVREQLVKAESYQPFILRFLDGKTTRHYPGSKAASITHVKDSLQDSCNYLLMLGIPILDEQRARPDHFLPGTLRNESLEWKLDDSYWLVDKLECLKVTNNRSEVFMIDPRIGYSVRWARLETTLVIAFDDFRQVSGKWMPFQVETSGTVNSKISVTSLDFVANNSLDQVLPPGTLVTNEIEDNQYFMDEHGNRQDVLGAIDEAKEMLPGRRSFTWLVVFSIFALIVVGVYLVMLRGKKR
ncbi:MAG: hypothetical protein JNL67_08845 [Planctomycetaceae bacterium]|nr:hypothetical protein [Planctomycetaceae bacterium]